MYTRTREELWPGFSPSIRGLSGTAIGEPQLPREVASVDVKRAAEQNRSYEKKLKWDTQVNKIKSFLMSALGLSSIATREDFAQAVATWQYRYGGDKKPDGVIGPNTWAKLQSAMKAAGPPPVSPSQVSAIPNTDKDPKNLAIGIYEAEFITLEAWRSALDQFGEVMKAVSDKEGTANFAGVVQKYIQGKLLDTVASQSKTVSIAKGLLDALVAESNRANQAREGAQLRDFIVRFQRGLNDARVQLSARKDDYFHLVEKNYEGGTEAAKSVYKKQLVEYLDRLDKMREDGWLSNTYIFRIWAFEWIRNSTKANPNVAGASAEESLVIVWVNYVDKVEKARIRAPGGQKIAEQLLKDADGAGLRPYEWPVRRQITYYAQNNWPMAYSRLTAQGTLDSRLRHPTDNEDVADRKFKRLLALRPTTKDVAGE